jgi:pantoate--beta-alanine ligase
MKVFHTIAEFRAWRQSTPPGQRNPFVPTMGALHEGHASLVRQARAMAGSAPVSASIFVNPTQFGPNEDFTKYPRTLESDVSILAESGCDAVFVPSAQEMYAGQAAHSQAEPQAASVDPGPLANILEGAIRPGHFRGVCTVVLKLLNITQPTHLLLGQKDFQQQAVLRQMVADLNVPVDVVTCPTVRESDGLAMSSRNRYLNPDERARAIALHDALSWAKLAYNDGERNVATLEHAMQEKIAARGLAVQYAVARHAETLREFSGAVASPCVFLVAAKLGSTRLIDNLLPDQP